MTGLRFAAILGIAGAAVALGVVQASADVLPTPALSGPIVGNATPVTFDAGPIGTIDVGGVVSGLALWQTNHSTTPGDHDDLVDFSNGQLFVQKTTGLDPVLSAGRRLFASQPRHALCARVDRDQREFRRRAGWLP